MRITKEYETKLNLTVEEIYSGGLGGNYNVKENSIILDKLRTRYENRCKDKTFINNIVEIKQRSMINFDKSELDGTGSVYVIFVAESTIYPTNSILVGCVVKSVERNGKILCEYDNAVVYIKGDVRYPISIGDKIIVKIDNTGYPTDEKCVAVAGRPYFDQRDFELILVSPNDHLHDNDKDELKKILSLMELTENKFKSLNNKESKFYTDLFYPFKSKLDKLPNQFKQISLKDLLIYYSTGKGKGIFDKSIVDDRVVLSSHAIIPKHIPDIFMFSVKDAESLPKHKLLTDKSVLTIHRPRIMHLVQSLCYLSYKYINFLNLIIDVVSIYNTETSREKHKNIWAFYERHKV